MHSDISRPCARGLRRTLTAFLATAVFLLLFSANAAEPAAGRVVRIVATTFPAWDWTREILGDRISSSDLVLLQHPGSDLHGYEPTAADLRAIAECDLFIHVGGESDAWVPAALALGGNPSRRILSLVAALGDKAKPERQEEGMEAETEDAPATDEHVWLSLRNAQILVATIADALADADSANADTYRRNAAAYAACLADLDTHYADAFAAAPRRTLLFADRFPFRYLADDYGLTCIAPFPGCSAESAASFRTVVYLARRIDELGLTAIFTLEAPSHRLAETVRSATTSRSQNILVLDSMQSLSRDWRNRSYFDAMHSNLDRILSTLGVTP